MQRKLLIAGVWYFQPDFSTLFNDFGAKKPVRSNWVLILTELFISIAQCTKNLGETEIHKRQATVSYVRSYHYDQQQWY